MTVIRAYASLVLACIFISSSHATDGSDSNAEREALMRMLDQQTEIATPD